MFLFTSDSSITSEQLVKPYYLFVRIIVFVFPLVMVFIAFMIPAFVTGDSLPINYAVKIQQYCSRETIYMPGFYSHQFNVYKLAGIRLLSPSILIVGSSRVMEFRSVMFHPYEDEFYNAGGILKCVNDLTAFSYLMSIGFISPPDVLIIGIDPWWIKQPFSTRITWLFDDDDRMQISNHVIALRKMIKDLLLDPRMNVFSIAFSESPRIFEHIQIGSYAIAYGDGFRQDGSYLYTQDMLRYSHDSCLINDGVIENRIIQHQRQFSLPASIDMHAVDNIIDAIKCIQNENVEVYAFMPPFSTNVYNALQNNTELSKWWQFYKYALPELLINNNINVIPLTYPEQMGLSDDHMFDGYHPSEVFLAYILLHYITQYMDLPYVNEVWLNNILCKADSPLAFLMPIAKFGNRSIHN